MSGTTLFIVCISDTRHAFNLPLVTHTNDRKQVSTTSGVRTVFHRRMGPLPVSVSWVFFFLFS